MISTIFAELLPEFVKTDQYSFSQDKRLLIYFKNWSIMDKNKSIFDKLAILGLIMLSQKRNRLHDLEKSPFNLIQSEYVLNPKKSSGLFSPVGALLKHRSLSVMSSVNLRKETRNVSLSS
jgi:hypothetical protein